MKRRGKYEILAEQYSDYLPRVLNYMRLRVDDEALAQELTAGTFERALSRLHTLRDEGALGGWLFSIARTQVAGHYRRRRPQVSLDSLADCPSPDPSVEGLVVQGEEWQVLCAALRMLSEREQEVIRLRFVAGLTNRAVARVMGLSEGNVAVILYRALSKVRHWVEIEEEGCPTSVEQGQSERRPVS